MIYTFIWSFNLIGAKHSQHLVVSSSRGAWFSCQGLSVGYLSIQLIIIPDTFFKKEKEKEKKTEVARRGTPR